MQKARYRAYKARGVHVSALSCMRCKTFCQGENSLGMKMISLKGIKESIKKSVLSLATSKNNKPHQIAVADIKVLDNRIIITDNFMQETKRNIISNKNVSLIFWSDNGGYELKGKADYFSSGKWLDFVRNLKENKGLKPKGAIIVKIKKIKRLK